MHRCWLQRVPKAILAFKILPQSREIIQGEVSKRQYRQVASCYTRVPHRGGGRESERKRKKKSRKDLI